jgi:hypothetical protein
MKIIILSLKVNLTLMNVYASMSYRVFPLSLRHKSSKIVLKYYCIEFCKLLTFLFSTIIPLDFSGLIPHSLTGGDAGVFELLILC